LYRAGFDKRLLDRMQPGRLFPTLLRMVPYAFDGLDAVALGLRARQRTRIHRTAVQQNGARAAFTFLTAAEFHAKKAFAPQHRQQSVTWRDGISLQVTID